MFPPPTPQQARVLWFSLTALAIAIVVMLAGILLWGLGMVLNQLSAVLLPLAVAGVIACLLNPVVDFLERRNVPRTRAILLVFFVAIGLVLALLVAVVPMLIFEIGHLIERLPAYAAALREKFSDSLEHSPWGARARVAWEDHFGENVQQWLVGALPAFLAWLNAQLSHLMSWTALAIGFALVPVYVFYFLLEKRGIQRNWTRYVPLRESEAKEEAVFVIKEINDRMVAFFRGQVVVAICVGAMLTAGFLILGLNYAVLLGVTAGALSIVPFLGVFLSIAPALALSAVQFGTWYHPVLVLLLFVVVQTIESLFISPKIMAGRVGLHPVTIIVAVMAGTALMGGILGGLLAIPLTAVLRTLMFRYIWRRERRSRPARKATANAGSV